MRILDPRERGAAFRFIAQAGAISWKLSEINERGDAMKISDISAEKVKLELLVPFVTAAAPPRTFQYTVLIKMSTDAGVYGVGEAVPTRHITAETVDSVLMVIDELREKLLGMDPLRMEEIHSVMDKHIAGNSSAKAAIDIALYDIKGKIMGAPLYKVLGGFRSVVETNVTLSIQKPEQLAAAAKKEVERGFHTLKIKIGLEPDEDIEGIRLVREAVGDKIKIKVDANQGYSYADAIRTIEGLKKYGVISIEQPRPSWDVDGMAYVRSNTGFTIIADEGVFSPVDAVRHVKKEACDMVNIKLMKSGGIFKAEKINAICEAAGLPCMVGCMVESRVSITAGAHFAASKRNVVDTDLDGFILTKELPYVSGGFTADGGVITLLDKPGLGLDVDF